MSGAMRHDWRSLYPERWYPYSTERTERCTRCGTLRETSTPLDAYGLTNGLGETRYLPPGRPEWSIAEPPCVAAAASGLLTTQGR